MSPARWRDVMSPIDRRRWWERLRKWKWLIVLLALLSIGSIIWNVADDDADAGDAVTTPAGAEYQVRVVNAIPANAADEESDNSEPFLAVNPQNADEMVMSAHMLGWGGVCEPDHSALLRSVDRGRTWGLHCALEVTKTQFAGDISIAFSGDGKRLYGGFSPASPVMRVHLIKTAPDGSPTWPVEHIRPAHDPTLTLAHMPWAAAGADATADVVAIGLDAVGVKDCNSGVVYWNVGTSSFEPICRSARSSEALRGPWTPVIRTAVHIDGTIYAATFRIHEQPDWPGGLLDVVVFRHEKGSAASFADQLDVPVTNDADPCKARDGLPGYRVVRCVPVPFEDLGPDETSEFGQERRMWSALALAVDPNNSRRVFVAWGDTAGPTQGMTLHVRESTDGGTTWGATDLVTVQRGHNPALAVSAEGRLGFSYQRLEGSGSAEKWVTEVQVVGSAKFTLATMPARDPIRCILPYVGDYMNLVAVGNDFFGAFSTSADITPSNFPSGIATPKRNPSTPDPQVCQDPPEDAERSIDPYFFAIERVTGGVGGAFLMRGATK